MAVRSKALVLKLLNRQVVDMNFEYLTTRFLFWVVVKGPAEKLRKLACWPRGTENKVPERNIALCQTPQRSRFFADPTNEMIFGFREPFLKARKRIVSEKGHPFNFFAKSGKSSNNLECRTSFGWTQRRHYAFISQQT
jgi:hypothetical protein